MTSAQDHHRHLLQDGVAGSQIPLFLPFSVDQFRNYVQHPSFETIAPDLLRDIWMIPIARHLQSAFRLDPRGFVDDPTVDEVDNPHGLDSNGIGRSGRPTLQQLKKDFTIACAIFGDKLAENPEDLLGNESVDGSSRKMDVRIPDRVHALLQPYSAQGRYFRS